MSTILFKTQSKREILDKFYEFADQGYKIGDLLDVEQKCDGYAIVLDTDKEYIDIEYLANGTYWVIGNVPNSKNVG